MPLTPLSIPRPSRRNPFKPGTPLAAQFEGMLTAYDAVHPDLLREGGTVRCRGNSWADNFWLGYDGVPPMRVPKGTFAWACYRAGQTQRLRDDAAGRFVPASVKAGSLGSLRPVACAPSPQTLD